MLVLKAGIHETGNQTVLHMIDINGNLFAFLSISFILSPYPPVDYFETCCVSMAYIIFSPGDSIVQSLVLTWGIFDKLSLVDTCHIVVVVELYKYWPLVCFPLTGANVHLLTNLKLVAFP